MAAPALSAGPCVDCGGCGFNPFDCGCGGETCPPIIDDFDRANAPDLGETDTGQAWTPDIAGGLGINSNTAAAQGFIGLDFIDLASVRPTNDASFYVEFDLVTSTDSSVSPQVSLTGDGTLTVGVEAAIGTNGGNGIVEIFSSDGGYAPPADLFFYVDGATLTVRIEVDPSSTTVTVSVDGSDVSSHSDVPADVFNAGTVGGLGVNVGGGGATDPQSVFTRYESGCI